MIDDWLIDLITSWVAPEVLIKLFTLSFRYNNVNNNVLVYQISNDLPLGQSVSFQYKATTVSSLLPSIFVSSPVYLSYVTLPPSLAPREGRKYEENSDQVLCDVCKWVMNNSSLMLHTWEVIVPSCATETRISLISLNVLVFYHQCCCLIGYATCTIYSVWGSEQP